MKKVDSFQEIAMTKKSPDKREQKRLKKIEESRQSKRYRAAMLFADGCSLREVANAIHMSHEFVRTWADKLVDKTQSWQHKRINPDGSVEVRTCYRLKEGCKAFLPTKKPGPRPGFCPKVEAIKGAVAAECSKPYRDKLGAAKIAVIGDIPASAPTVRKTMRLLGIDVPTRKRKGHRKRFCRRASNDQWNIDFVEIGVDIETGKKVESLSVTDDHSRFSFSCDATISATTDHVFETLEELFKIYGVPRIINSDHGTQWYAVKGGESRFDDFCSKWGIEHRLAPIRTPEENGKVERYHGILRVEAGLPEEASVEKYRRILSDFRTFYNEERPHWSLGLRTPSEVYYKPPKDPDGALRLIREALEGSIAGPTF